MTEVIVDTDVVSFVFKNHPIGSRYDPELAGKVAAISFPGSGGSAKRQVRNVSPASSIKSQCRHG